MHERLVSPCGRSWPGWWYMAHCMSSATSTLRVSRVSPLPCGDDRKNYLTLSSNSVLADFAAGKTAALARVVSIVENRREGSDAILASLHPKTGKARRIGITGPPGPGKSTITTLLAREY